MTDFKPGDRVRVVRAWKDHPGRLAGRVGRLILIDPLDRNFPYAIGLDDGARNWVHSVERI